MKVFFAIIIAILLFNTNDLFSTNKNVLVIHSYHQGYEWTDNINVGITSVFDTVDVDLYFEYLDTKRTFSEEYLFHLFELQKSKTRVDFDVIIVSDNNGLEFLKKYHEKLYPDVPIVFCGINNYSEELIKDINNITGIIEGVDFKRTIDLITKLNPERTKVIIINDKLTTTGKENKKFLINEVIPQYNKSLEFEFFEDYSLEELSKLSVNLGDDEVIYLLTYSKDIYGNFYENDEVVNFLSKNSIVPIYGSWGFYLGNGIIGGKLTTGNFQGEQASLMAYKILNGAKANEIPIIKDEFGEYMFDYNYLKKFNIDSNNLPLNSKVINKPPTFIETYKGFLYVLILILVIITITLLVVNIRKRRIAKELIDANIKLDKKVNARTIELKKISSFLQTLIDSIPNPIYYKDENGAYLGCNLAFSKFFNLSKSDVIGKKVTDIAQQDKITEYYDVDMDILKKQKNISQEGNIKDAKGETHDVVIFKAPFTHPSSQEKGLIGIILDVTEQKNIESQLRDANATKDRFFSIIAHDLKNPFHTLMGLSSILLENYIDFDEKKVKMLLENINSVSKNTYNLLVTLLEWSRSQAGKIEYKPINIDISLYAIESISTLEQMASEKQISIINNITEKLIVYADSNMLHTIIRNLITNAIKFTNSGDKIELSSVIKDNFVEISIIDNGVGISENDLRNMFKIDSKVQYRGTEDEAGSGLGLLLCKDFIEANKGRIWVESSLGNGSTFTFTLPLVKK